MGFSNGHFTTGQNNTVLWQSGIAYALNDIVVNNSTHYICLSNHTGAANFLDDVDAGRWRVIDSKIITGSLASPIEISAATTIATISGVNQDIYIRSNSGFVTLTSNPQMEVGTINGEIKTLIGTSDTNYIRIVDGNGMKLNGFWESYLDNTLTLRWNGTIWVEIGRNYV
jgi:hypothetical protein